MSESTSESTISCFACDKEPTQQCPRCGRPYCDDHGQDLCDACLEPASGVPSFTLYRGSLLALLIGAVLAIFLLVQPEGGSTEGVLGPVEVTFTPTLAAATSTPAATDTTPTSETPAAGSTQPAGETTPESTSAAGGGSLTYTVEPGDTLLAICTAVGPARLSALECVDEVLANNGLGDPNEIAPGDELAIPQ